MHLDEASISINAIKPSLICCLILEREVVVHLGWRDDMPSFPINRKACFMSMIELCHRLRSKSWR